MKNYLKFKDDRRSTTDDFLFKQAAKESMISTLGGVGITVLGMLIPVAIAFSDLPVNVKIGAFGSGGTSSVAGALISRFKPNVPDSKPLEEQEAF